MNKVYVVVSGEYSDYGIEAIFSTREAAEEYMKVVTLSYSPAIEEWDIDVPRDGWYITTVTMKKDGAIYGSPSTNKKYRFDSDDNHFQFVYSELPDGPYILVHVRTESVTKAVKTANEVRGQLIALGRWGKAKGVIKGEVSE
jgi:hypothetical protein